MTFDLDIWCASSSWSYLGQLLRSFLQDEKCALVGYRSRSRRDVVAKYFSAKLVDATSSKGILLG